jgi:hypothetical protein
MDDSSSPGIHQVPQNDVDIILLRVSDLEFVAFAVRKASKIADLNLVVESQPLQPGMGGVAGRREGTGYAIRLVPGYAGNTRPPHGAAMPRRPDAARRTGAWPLRNAMSNMQRAMA